MVNSVETSRAQRFAWGVMLALSAGCQEPTQITLHLKTDVPYGVGSQLTITAASPEDVEWAEIDADPVQEWDETGEIGTLVVLPEDDPTGRVGIRVVLGVAIPTMNCASNMKGCIVARRRLQFIEHKPLFVPIGLHAICEGMPCDPESTCNALGNCVPSDISASKCGEPDARECMITGETELPSATILDGGADGGTSRSRGSDGSGPDN
jgi:hypothetical protein